ncbi:hypothetical protein AB0D08_13810 [Kitasatospora sp. NPDC048540]|uniref:hypothetical protein n=1 Tax=unclassified Kitasatospora TaxID=2633591 RepID=UPI0007C6CC3E|nr:hypothetical protein [Kitasatospora sp. MBT63]
MAFDRIDEIPTVGTVFRIETVGGRGSEVVLTVSGPGALGRLRLPAADVAGLRSALDRALAAAAEPGAPRPEEGLVRRFHAGESIARLAARYGRTPDAVRARLRELGHDPRRPEHCPQPAGQGRGEPGELRAAAANPDSVVGA